MIRQSISHYQILEKLGEGGMGVVYKAHDTKLDRIVALKFLPHHIATSETDRARFLQEARAASQINHPNVCTIYDIKEEEGEQFIVMEYVDGVTLHDKIQVVPLGKEIERNDISFYTINDVITYTIQIAEALRKAHSKSIIHRDIKSDNIMITTDGQIKIMDFGLAKLKYSIRITKTSSTVGTLAYMAPEQIKGAEADERSDIFSFGVVIFEMLTGKLPFHGVHEPAIMYSILNESPDSIIKYRQDVPDAFIAIIKKMLEKKPENRFQHVDEIVQELMQLRSGLNQSFSSQTVLSVQQPARISQTDSIKVKRRFVVPVTMLVLIFIFAIGGYFIFQKNGDRDKITSVQDSLRLFSEQKLYVREKKKDSLNKIHQLTPRSDSLQSSAKGIHQEKNFQRNENKVQPRVSDQTSDIKEKSKNNALLPLPSDDARQLLRLGRKLFDEGKYIEAKEKFIAARKIAIARGQMKIARFTVDALAITEKKLRGDTTPNSRQNDGNEGKRFPQKKFGPPGSRQKILRDSVRSN